MKTDLIKTDYVKVHKGESQYMTNMTYFPTLQRTNTLLQIYKTASGVNVSSHQVCIFT